MDVSPNTCGFQLWWPSTSAILFSHPLPEPYHRPSPCWESQSPVIPFLCHPWGRQKNPITSFPCLKLFSTCTNPNSFLWASGPYKFWPLPTSPVSSWTTLPLTLHSSLALHPFTATVVSPPSSHQTSQTNSHYLLSLPFHFPFTPQDTKCGFSSPQSSDTPLSKAMVINCQIKWVQVATLVLKLTPPKHDFHDVTFSFFSYFSVFS